MYLPSIATSPKWVSPVSPGDKETPGVGALVSKNPNFHTGVPPTLGKKPGFYTDSRV